MYRHEVLALLITGLMATDACPCDEAQERAETLLDEYLLDPAYRVEGEEVPDEFVVDLLANI
jgi:hypothetical protein